jgi:uncharacterized protein
MILVDTSAVIAMLDTSEENHEAVIAFWGRKLILPVTLLAEIDYLVTKRLGAHIARAFLKGLEAKDLELLGFEPEDLTRANAIMAKYPNVPLGLADSSIIALAERYRVKQILTLDRRHFSLVRPRGLEYLRRWEALNNPWTSQAVA